MSKAISKSVHMSHTSTNEDLEEFSNSQEPTNMTYTSENEFQDNFKTSHESSSDEEIVLRRSQPKPSKNQVQAVQQVYMSYIEGPQMD